MKTYFDFFPFQFDHLYAYFMSAKDEDEKLQRLRDFIKGFEWDVRSIIVYSDLVWLKFCFVSFGYKNQNLTYAEVLTTSAQCCFRVLVILKVIRIVITSTMSLLIHVYFTNFKFNIILHVLLLSIKYLSSIKKLAYFSGSSN